MEKFERMKEKLKVLSSSYFSLLVIVLTTAAPAFLFLMEVCTGNDCLCFKTLYFSYRLDYFDVK